jgi:hypothetical protein
MRCSSKPANITGKNRIGGENEETPTLWGEKGKLHLMGPTEYVIVLSPISSPMLLLSKDGDRANLQNIIISRMLKFQT